MSDSMKGFVIAALLVGAILAIPAISNLQNSSKANSSIQQSTSTSTPVEKPKKNGTEVEYKSQYIPYETQYVKDSTLEYGKQVVRSSGSQGIKTITYEVEYKDGVEVSRKQVDETVTTKPVDRVIADGTRIVWHCKDTTSYDKNPYNDNYCTSSTGESRYTTDSQARQLDPTYTPGKAGHYYYNSF